MEKIISEKNILLMHKWWFYLFAKLYVGSFACRSHFLWSEEKDKCSSTTLLTNVEIRC